jgi:hypothetical protein
MLGFLKVQLKPKPAKLTPDVLTILSAVTEALKARGLN